MKKMLRYMKIESFNRLFKLMGHRFNLNMQAAFNSTVKKQLKHPEKIPIIIISFNQLKYLKQLVDFLLGKGMESIVILDNNSTYKPLLDYFETVEDKVTVIRKEKNLGHLSFWKNRDVFSTYSKGYYVVTDADVVPIDDCPDDLMVRLMNLLDMAFDRTKVGLSLKINDIPNTNPNQKEIMDWESQYWRSKITHGVFKAEVDTTFAMYRPKYDYRLKHFTKAWRTDYPYQARHGGWYLDLKNLSEEQKYYMKTANESASWQIDEKGELINKVHKPLYSNE